MPGLSDRVLRHTDVASEVGTKTDGCIPNITGQIENFTVDSYNTQWQAASGALRATLRNGTSVFPRIQGNNGSAKRDTIYFDASWSSSIYKTDVNYVRPKSTLVRYVIKY